MGGRPHRSSRHVHHDRLLCDSRDRQSPPLRRRNGDLRKAGGL